MCSPSFPGPPEWVASTNPTARAVNPERHPAVRIVERLKTRRQVRKATRTADYHNQAASSCAYLKLFVQTLRRNRTRYCHVRRCCQGEGGNDREKKWPHHGRTARRPRNH